MSFNIDKKPAVSEHILIGDCYNIHIAIQLKTALIVLHCMALCIHVWHAIAMCWHYHQENVNVVMIIVLTCLLSSIYFIGRKRNLWTAHPVLQFCFSATNLHSMVLEFLSSVLYDHSILLDFLISPETPQFHTFLAEYLEICIADWNDLTVACQEAGIYLLYCKGNFTGSTLWWGC